jgi:hypothetical protein
MKTDSFSCCRFGLRWHSHVQGRAELMARRHSRHLLVVVQTMD